jgi:hypothetical protein
MNEACHEMFFREVDPTLEFSNMQNQIWMVAISVERASLLK